MTLVLCRSMNDARCHTQNAKQLYCVIHDGLRASGLLLQPSKWLEAVRLCNCLIAACESEIGVTTDCPSRVHTLAREAHELLETAIQNEVLVSAFVGWLLRVSRIG